MKQLLALAVLLPAFSPARAAYPVKVRGADEASFSPKTASLAVEPDTGAYDAVVVGGGLAGLSSALYLSDRGRSVLLLEKEPALGGLAAGATMDGGVPYNRGAAYWTSAYDEEQKILEHIGLGAYQDMHAIPEPIDSYFWNGRLYEGIWDDKTLEELPASFALFRSELRLADKAKLIPNQPIEESGALDLDAMTAAEWIRKMPSQAALRTDEEPKKIYERYLKDSALPKDDPMGGVVGLMDLYCRSALGTTADRVSALAFANFYISEIETRYTTARGTGEAASLMERTLRGRGNLVTIRTGATAYEIAQSSEAVRVSYAQGGKRREARAAWAVYAGQLKFAPKILAGLAQAEPEKTKAIEALDYADYSVTVARTEGHPYRATYDTWFHPKDFRSDDFTDVILGRWMDPALRGYEGYRDFKKDPADREGLFALYQPLPLGFVGRGYTKEQAEAAARTGVDRLLESFNPMLKERWGTQINVLSVETNRWPYSVHVAKPGHFGRAKLLRKPYGRVFFANNNLGTPAFEEALFRGHCAADNILKRLDPAFAFEPWSKCPPEP